MVSLELIAQKYHNSGITCRLVPRLLIFACQYQHWSKFLQIGLKRVFIRIDARSDRSGPPVRCHAGQSARARVLTRTSRCAAVLTGPVAPAPARPHHSPPPPPPRSNPSPWRRRFRQSAVRASTAAARCRSGLLAERLASTGMAATSPAPRTRPTTRSRCYSPWSSGCGWRISGWRTLAAAMS